MDSELLKKIDPDSCVALIPARGGSKSIPGKNIRLFKGYPLIAYSIAAAKLAKEIERVIVSTDSEEIASIAVNYGAEVPFLRPAEFAQDNSPDIDFVRHAIQWFADKEGRIPEYIVHIRITTPIRDYRVIDEGIARIRRDKMASSLRSGHICVHPPYKWLQFSDTGYMEPLMPGISCDEANQARQGFPEVLVPNSYVDVLKADYVIANDLMHGDHMIGLVTDEGPDIDTEEDLHKLEVYQGQKKAFIELNDYLSGIGG